MLALKSESLELTLESQHGIFIYGLQFQTAQCLRIDGDDDCRERHQDRTDPGWQDKTPRGKDASGERQSNGVVANGPGEILDHLAIGGLAQMHNARYVTWIVAHQHNAG